MSYIDTLLQRAQAGRNLRRQQVGAITGRAPTPGPIDRTINSVRRGRTIGREMDAAYSGQPYDAAQDPANQEVNITAPGMPALGAFPVASSAIQQPPSVNPSAFMPNPLGRRASMVGPNMDIGGTMLPWPFPRAPVMPGSAPILDPSAGPIASRTIPTFAGRTMGSAYAGPWRSGPVDAYGIPADVTGPASATADGVPIAPRTIGATFPATDAGQNAINVRNLKAFDQGMTNRAPEVLARQRGTLGGMLRPGERGLSPREREQQTFQLAIIGAERTAREPRIMTDKATGAAFAVGLDGRVDGRRPV